VLHPSLTDLCAMSIRKAPGETKGGTLRVQESPHYWVWSLHGWGAGAGEAREFEATVHAADQKPSSSFLVRLLYR
jgi:hypothetical protein